MFFMCDLAELSKPAPISNRHNVDMESVINFDFIPDKYS